MKRTRIRAWCRRAIQAVPCMLIGAMTTVAVSWSCALWSPHPSLPPFQIMGMQERDGSLRPMPQTAGGGSFGFRLELDKHIEWQNGRTAIGLADDADRQASGWPFLAMECGVVHNTQNPPRALVHGPVRIGSNAAGGPWLLDGLSVYNWPRLGAKPWRFLPLRPRPVGFAVNTLGVAAVLWFAAFGWRDARRLAWARHGRCAACGYPVTGLGRCPECGEAVWAGMVRSVKVVLGALVPRFGERGAVR